MGIEHARIFYFSSPICRTSVGLAKMISKDRLQFHTDLPPAALAFIVSLTITMLWPTVDYYDELDIFTVNGPFPFAIYDVFT